MANTPFKNRKLPPWITEAVKHWRWQEDRLHPLFEVTAPEYSGLWMEEIDTLYLLQALHELAEERFIERLLRIERQTTIDKLLKDATRSYDANLRQKVVEGLKLLRAARSKRQRQRIINKLLADAHGRN